MAIKHAGAKRMLKSGGRECCGSNDDDDNDDDDDDAVINIIITIVSITALSSSSAKARAALRAIRDVVLQQHSVARMKVRNAIQCTFIDELRGSVG